MPANFLYSFPLSHEQAVKILFDAPWSPQERNAITQSNLPQLFDPLGGRIREHWYLGDKSYPLPRHYMRRFGLGDDGDMSSLIILDFLAHLHSEKFNLSGYVEEFRRQWIVKGIDPVTLEKIPKTS